MRDELEKMVERARKEEDDIKHEITSIEEDDLECSVCLKESVKALQELIDLFFETEQCSKFSLNLKSFKDAIVSKSDKVKTDALKGIQTLQSDFSKQVYNLLEDVRKIQEQARQLLAIQR